MEQVLMIWVPANRSTLQKNHYLASGLSGNGVNVSVINLCHTKDEYEQFITLLGRNRNYTYDPGPLGPLYKGKFKITKLINNIKISINLIKKLKKIFTVKKNLIIIVPRESLEVAIITFAFKQIFPITVIGNIMEHSPSLPCFSNNIRNRICWKLILKYSDAYIVISHFLLNTLGALKPTFYLPAIIDTTFQLKPNYLSHSLNNMANIDKTSVLLYTSHHAYLELLDFCIKALSLIKNENFIFIVTGTYPEADFNELSKKIKRLGLSNKVKFTGHLSEANFLKIVRASKALLIPLLNNKRHNARFPQKILEYTLMRKVIISTAVGEIAEYFTDNVDAFIDNTITPEGFSIKIKNVLTEHELVKKISSNAEILIKKKFDNHLWGLKLKIFITELQI